MIRNYIIVAFRNIVRQPGYSSINVAGLAIGMACAVLIASFVLDELRYTTYHKDSDRIYRLLSVYKTDSGSESITTGVMGGLTLQLKASIPEVEQVTRLSYGWGKQIVQEEGFPLGQSFMTIDRDGIDMFGIELLRGDLKAFENPYAVYLTESSAERLFGDEDPMGKPFTSLSRYGGGEYVVAGLIKDLERHSSLRIDMIKGNMKFWGTDQEENRGGPLVFWENWNAGQGWRPVGSYVKLRSGVDPKVVEAKLTDMVIRRHGAEYAETERFVLQPLNRIYLHTRSDYGNINIQYTAGFGRQGDIQNVMVLSLISVALVLIACINYINLATARYARRAREVGLRKVLGAYKQQLVIQFLGESVLLSLVAATFAAAIVQILLPEFGTFMDRNLVEGLGVSELLVGLFGVGLVIGVVGGLYPAFYLASREAVQTLKGPIKGSRKSSVRYGLVLGQFAATAILMAGTLTVYDQLQYLRTRNLGFDSSQIMTLGMFGADRTLNQSYNQIKDAFIQHPNIEAASAAHLLPGGRRETQSIWAEGHGQSRFNMRLLGVDEDFIGAFGLDLYAGRNMTPGPVRDGEEIILNETAARMLGWDPDALTGETAPIGKRFGWSDFTGEVVGLVRDFHIASLKEPIEPVFITKWWPKFNWLTLRVKTTNVPETRAYCESLWERYLPNTPFFGMQFMDERLNRQYDDEERLGTMGLIFSGIAIAVACLGLLGLAAYTAEQATKEIGVRRTLGASVGSVFTLLSREFVSVVVIGNLLTWPISYYLLNQWLQSFAYRIEVGVTPFLLSFIGSFLITLATVSYQVWSAARRDPVDALRYE